MIRIIHEYPHLPEGLLADVRGLRDLVDEAELYVSLAEGEDSCAVVLLCRDEAQYAGVLADLDRFPVYHEIVRDGVTEIYRRERYGLEDNMWVPVAGRQPSIVWPADGAVRIVISYAVESNEEMRALTAREIADTRREPGCLVYSWFENVELPDHLLLLELWEDQRLYDLHWSGRMATTDYRGTSGRTARTPDRGERTLEFYRRQEFSLHYGRMLPASADDYSDSVIWPSR